jgi:hypothetical protein
MKNYVGEPHLKFIRVGVNIYDAYDSNLHASDGL